MKRNSPSALHVPPVIRTAGLLVPAVLILLLTLLPAAVIRAAEVKIDSATFGAIEARAIGPAVMGGRIAALDAIPGETLTIYIGAAGGGVWKSTDGGTTFEPVFDDHPQCIGAVTIDQEEPETVWVGTGEPWTRNSVSVGAGLYKTTDGGEGWELVGLEQTERISRIVIDHADRETVYVAALGHLWNANEERGLYKTTDGGKTWNQVLYVDADTGCTDVVIDPQDSNIVYAAMWQFRRQPHTFTSGGPGSGLFKSADGGETWRRIAAGLPEGDLGRIALAVAPSRPSTVYATIEAEENAFYRSLDFGETWKEMTDSGGVGGRPFYFSLLVPDPEDFNRIYKPGSLFGVSTDGGETFSSSYGGYHPDLHALWVNPRNPRQLLLGTDGGVYVSYNRGGSWLYLNPLPVSQFYRVSVDNDWPYNVYGGLQDNGSWRGPSRSPAGIENRDWENIGGGDGFYAVPDPEDTDLVYVEWQGGNVMRRSLSLGESKDIKPLPAEGEPEYRFNWNTPVYISPHEPVTLFIGGQFLFRSTDRGESWEKISPDLTTNDPEKQRQHESGGLTIDDTTAENHCSIYTISQSPLDADVIWAGTDDGNLQVTRDGGAAWENVAGAIQGLPAGTWCSGVEAGHHAAGTAYAVFDGHRTGDMTPYLYRTDDSGATWTALTAEPVTGYAHVIREDPQYAGLLWLGTEFGLFVTVDGGENWARFTGNLPEVSVRDIALQARDADVVLATHGRGIYIIDDITPLRQLTTDVLQSKVAILEPRPAVQVIPASSQQFNGDDVFVGSNPSSAAAIVYYLQRRHIFGDLKVEIRDSVGELITTLPGGKRRGINRVSWPMRMKAPKVAASKTLSGAGYAFSGPLMPEGEYSYTVIKGKETFEGAIHLVPDPRSPHSAEDRGLQQELVLHLYDLMEGLAYTADMTASARDQAEELAGGLKEKDRLRKDLETLAAELSELHGTMTLDEQIEGISMERRLREQLAALYGSINGYAGRPTKSQIDRADRLEKEVDVARTAFEAVHGAGLKAVNTRLAKKGLEPITLLTLEEWHEKREAGVLGREGVSAGYGAMPRVVLR